MGIELMTTTITGLEVYSWSNSANMLFVATLRFSDHYKVMLLNLEMIPSPRGEVKHETEL